MRDDNVSPRLVAALLASLVIAGCPPTVENAPPPVPKPAVSATASVADVTPAPSPGDGDGGGGGESGDDIRVTDTGLGIEDLKVGKGPTVVDNAKVTVHYVGRLESGKVFDDSRKRGEPYTFKVGHGKVIAGWDEGVLGMQVGGIRRLTVPSKLAYGERGQMPAIRPNALLEFEIELIAID